MSDKEKTCETCAFWTKNPKTDEFGSYGECPWYTIEYGMLRVVPDGDGNFRPFSSFGCPKHEDKPAGPFMVWTFLPPTLYFEPSDKRAPLNIPVEAVVNLAQWLNELWAEREAGE